MISSIIHKEHPRYLSSILILLIIKLRTKITVELYIHKKNIFIQNIYSKILTVQSNSTNEIKITQLKIILFLKITPNIYIRHNFNFYTILTPKELK